MCLMMSVPRCTKVRYGTARTHVQRTARHVHMYGKRTWDGDPRAAGVVGAPLHLDGVAVVDHLRRCNSKHVSKVTSSRPRRTMEGLVEGCSRTVR